MILIVLLFPFYWMALTSIKPDEQLIEHGQVQPVLGLVKPTLKHIKQAIVEDYNYPRWLWNTMYVAAAATTLSIIASVLAAYAIVRLRFPAALKWSACNHLHGLSGAAVDLVHPAGLGVSRLTGCSICRYR